MYIRPITRLLLLFGLVNIIIGGAGAYISYHYVVYSDSERTSDIAMSNMALSNIVFYLGVAMTIGGAICFMIDYQDHIMSGYFDDGGRDATIWRR
jgi:hypothetical protein